MNLLLLCVLYINEEITFGLFMLKIVSSSLFLWNRFHPCAVWGYYPQNSMDNSVLEVNNFDIQKQEHKIS